MELKIYKDSAAAYEKICDTKTELSIELEALIPDYMPQVFKIVKSIAIPVVLQKRAGASRVTVEGYLRVLMYYQESAEGALCCLEQKQSFSKTFELEQSDFESADICTSGETEYINCRAVNERRVDIRGAYMLVVRAYACVKKQVITSLSGCGIQQSTAAIKSICTSQPYEKPVTLADEIKLAQTPEAIVDTSLSCSVSDCKLTSGKAVCKGEVQVTVLYRVKGASALVKDTKILPFNEIAELNSASDNDSVFVLVQPVSAAVTQGEGEVYKATASILLDIYSVGSSEVMAVSDAFSTEYETELSYDSIVCEIASQSARYKQEITLEGKMPDEDAEILGAVAEITAPEPAQLDSGTKLRGRVSAHVFCKNSLGEIDCYDKASEYILPAELTQPPEKLCTRTSAFIKELSARKAAGEMSVVILLETDGTVTQLGETKAVTSAECTTPREKKDDASLRIYYAEEGEKLFDIGKRYAASPQHIAQANGITAETLDEQTRLLIPLSV